MPDAGRFAGKIAVVTGGAHGIGLATARRLAGEGARVVVIDVDDDALAAAAGIEGIDAARADVATQGEVESAVAAIVEHHGTIDILHNNAGRLRAGSVTEVEVAEWDRTYAVNVRSMFLMCREVIPVMLRNGGGAIVNTASTSGLVGEVGIPAYNSSKGAVIKLTRQLAAEYARQGIRANCVCPGWIPDRVQRPGARGAVRRRGAGDGRSDRARRTSGHARGDCRGRVLPGVAGRLVRQRPRIGGRRRTHLVPVANDRRAHVAVGSIG